MANCQKCGAALPPGATACEYCGSLAEPGSPPGGEPRPRFYLPRTGEAVRFKKSSILGMLLCTLITVWLYVSLWYLLRRKSLISLDPARSKKINWAVGIFVSVHILYSCLCWGAAYSNPDLAGWHIYASNYAAELDRIANLFFVCLFGIWVYISFVIRSQLRSYAGRVSPGNPVNGSIASSVVWTFLFGIFYLQGQINRMIDARLLEAQP